MRTRPPTSLRVLALAAVLCAAPHDANACSLAPIWGVHSPSLVAFVGTPLADTVLAGDGSTRPVFFGRPSGFPGGRQIYGQRVRIDRLGEHARRVFPADAREVVLVPWAYGPDCTPLPWSGSARWLASAKSGLFRANLRPRSEWADGLPTFDIMGTFMQPYPETIDSARGARRPPFTHLPRLSVASLLRLYDRVQSMRDEPDSIAALALARDLSTDPEFAGRYPTNEFIHAAQREIDNARRRGVRIPMAGTFALDVRVGPSPPRTFFFRTADVVTGLERSPSPAFDSALSPPRPERYYFYAASSPAMDGLARSCQSGDGRTISYMYLDWHDAVPDGRAGEWRASLDTRVLEQFLTGEELQAWRAATQRTSRARSDSMSAWLVSLRARGLSPDSVPLPLQLTPTVDRPLRVVRDASGAVRIDGTIRTSEQPAIELRGERVSLDVLQCEAR